MEHWWGTRWIIIWWYDERVGNLAHGWEVQLDVHGGLGQVMVIRS